MLGEKVARKAFLFTHAGNCKGYDDVRQIDFGMVFVKVNVVNFKGHKNFTELPAAGYLPANSL